MRLLDELKDRNVYLLDKKGEDISKVEIKSNPIFIIGDHEGIPRKEKKYILKNKNVTPVSIGPKVYFASHVVVILNNILDRNEMKYKKEIKESIEEVKQGKSKPIEKVAKELGIKLK